MTKRTGRRKPVVHKVENDTHVPADLEELPPLDFEMDFDYLGFSDDDLEEMLAEDLTAMDAYLEFFDEELLALELEELIDLDFDMDTLGFSEEDIAGFLEELRAEAAEQPCPAIPIRPTANRNPLGTVRSKTVGE